MRLLLAAAILLGASRAGAVEDPTWTLDLITSSRGGYVFAGSDATKISNLGLVFGKTYGAAGKSYAFRPYGLEVGGRLPIASPRYIHPSFRLVPMGLRLSPAHPEQDGWDAVLSIAYAFRAPITETVRAGLELGLRLRRWQLESGPIPGSSHAGIFVAALLEKGRWDLLFEAGLMGMGVGNPASLGLQRDSSTLRLQVAYPVERFRPWIEFFHTHRDFYASQLLPGEDALFFDEAALSFGLGISL